MDGENTQRDALVRLEVRGLINDPVADTPIVILEPCEGGSFFPIWIGLYEANAIALCLESIATPRPMTHDLMASFLEGSGQCLERVVINALKDNVFRADLEFREPQGGTWHLDARPSDAIALALRTGTEIYTTRELLQQVKIPAPRNEEHLIRLFLEHLRPEDLGDYEM